MIPDPSEWIISVPGPDILAVSDAPVLTTAVLPNTAKLSAWPNPGALARLQSNFSAMTKRLFSPSFTMQPLANAIVAPAFAVVITQTGEPAYVLPGFEEMRARELIHVGNDIRIWQEDESPYQRIAQALKDRGVISGRIGIDESARFFVFDGIRKLAPKLDYVSAKAVLKSAGVETTAPRGGRR